MFRVSLCPIFLALAAALLASFGCTNTSGARLLLLPRQSDMVEFGVVADPPPLGTFDPVGLFNPSETYRPLAEALGAEIGRPTAVQVCFPGLLDSYLKDGHFDVAALTVTQYVDLAAHESYRVVAVSKDPAGRVERRGILVVRRDAPIDAIEELRGKRVLFGSPRDCRAHAAAKMLLAKSGLSERDIATDLLPTPGTLPQVTSAAERLNAVAAGRASAAFVDEADLESLPARVAANGRPARAQFREIAKTPPLPVMLIVCSPGLDETTVGRVQRFFINSGGSHPEALAPLGFQSFVAPSDETVLACRWLERN